MKEHSPNSIVQWQWIENPVASCQTGREKSGLRDNLLEYTMESSGIFSMKMVAFPGSLEHHDQVLKNISNLEQFMSLRRDLFHLTQSFSVLFT